MNIYANTEFPNVLPTGNLAEKTPSRLFYVISNIAKKIFRCAHFRATDGLFCGFLAPFHDGVIHMFFKIQAGNQESYVQKSNLSELNFNTNCEAPGSYILHHSDP